MRKTEEREAPKCQLDPSLPAGITVRAWADTDSDAIRQLSKVEGWPTPDERPGDTLIAWRNSWPTLIAEDGTQLVGFLRALSDGEVTTYLCELLVDPHYRGKGIGRGLMEACHRLIPRARMDLLSTVGSDTFYAAYGCRPFQGYRKNYQD